MNNSNIFLIDGNSFAYRAFYAIKNLKNSEGFPTNAVFGFYNMLNKLINEEKPDFLAVCFDMKEPTFRHRLYEEYKIHRKPMPEYLVQQLPWIKKILKVLNIKILQLEGYEADDIIATLAKKFCRENKVYIVSRDKDILQLVNHNIKAYRTDRKDSKAVIDKEEVIKKFGVKPENITDFLALKGDTSDNIPGAKGIGKKTAVNLINQYGCVEDILNNLDRIRSSKIKEKIIDSKQTIIMGKKLTILDIDVPVDVDIEDLNYEFNKNTKKNLIPIFESLNFHTLIKKIKSQ